MRSSVKMGLALFVAASSLASGASAQTASPGPVTSIPPRPDTTLTRGAGEIMSTMNQQRLEQREMLSRRERTTASDRMGMERARRLSQMINEGRCREAYQTALAERDTVMAAKIAQACTAEETTGEPGVAPN